MKANPWNDQLAMYMLSRGIIEVDSKGILWRLKAKHKNKAILDNIRPRKYSRHDNGYIRLQYRLQGILYSMMVHRIVWISKFGLIPHNYEINHKNGIRDGNRPENLELVTYSENILHGIRVLGRIEGIGELNGCAKLKTQQVLEIRRLYQEGGITRKELGEMFNMSTGGIAHILKRRSWKHI